MKKLETYEVDFIRETYPDPAWLVQDIAEKLEISHQTVHNYAKKLGVIRPRKSIRTPSRDWETLYYARESKATYEEAADAAGMSVKGAQAAMGKMLAMSEAERIVRWNKYRTRHGLPLFTKC